MSRGEDYNEIARDPKFQECCALERERKDLEQRIAETERAAAEADGEPAREVRRLLKKEVDSEEIAEVVSDLTGIPIEDLEKPHELPRLIVFVSYSVKDQEFAEREILPLIRQSGGAPWFDSFDLRPGGEFNRDLLVAIEKSDIFLLIMSPNSCAFGVRQRRAEACVRSPRSEDLR